MAPGWLALHIKVGLAIAEYTSVVGHLYFVGYTAACFMSHQWWGVCVISEPQVLNSTAPSYLPSGQTPINLPGAGCLWSRRQAAQVEASALHLAWLKSAIPPNVGNSGVQFLIVGDCVRAIPWQLKEMMSGHQSSLILPWSCSIYAEKRMDESIDRWWIIIYVHH